MPKLLVLIGAIVVLAATSTASTAREGSGGQVTASCAPLRTDARYARRVNHALEARRDVWGDALLARPRGPSYEGARGYLTPLLLARGKGGDRLTRSGVHYVAFTHPVGSEGSGSAALHVADGSEILSKRATGPALAVGVGRDGSERYGSCLARLSLPRLAQGYLPILQTRYVDADGARYRQESFATRDDATGSLVSYVSVSADARSARGDVAVRLQAGDSETFVVEAGTIGSVFARWSHASAPDMPRLIDATTYEPARAGHVRYWRARLREGATIDVPEPRVRDAVRSLLVQNLGLGWRYSVGNPYQQYSYPEALDVAQVMSAYGFHDVSAAIVRRSLSTPRGPYPGWRLGQRLVAVAAHYRRFRDRDLVEALTPDLRLGVGALESGLDRDGSGLLRRERFSSDVPDLVFGLHSQAVVWQGLREMGDVWSRTGEPALGERSRRLAAQLGTALRASVRRSSARIGDDLLFVPARLLDDERPYRSVTESRSGSYWNLVLPYALASGLFEPKGPEARGLLAYMLRRGSRLLGLVRAGAYSLYGRDARHPVGGVNPVYGLNVARFLADNDRHDQLALSLYGQLAVGMTPGTHMAGEAVSVSPLPGDYYRSTYLPPNAASNASFLETLRLMLVHETNDRTGRPVGLELADSIPRAWLEPGERIAVEGLATSFGPVSFSIRASSRLIHLSVAVPGRPRPKAVSMRLRLPVGDRVLRAVVDGRRAEVTAGRIDLSGRSGRVEAVVEVSRTSRAAASLGRLRWRVRAVRSRNG